MYSITHRIKLHPENGVPATGMYKATRMNNPFDRRDFLLALAGAGITLSGTPLGAATRPAPITSTRLSENLLFITGAGGNIVAAHDKNSVLMVDGGLAANVGAVLKLVEKETRVRGVQTLFNTHWHPEQTGSNERLGKAGTKIIAHENTRLWLGYANPLPDRSGSYGPLPVTARPNETIYTTGKLQFGNEAIEYGYLLQAHTDGDIYVFFPEANVLVTGDVACNDGWPLLDWRSGGWIGGMVDGLQKLIAVSNAETRIVPGRGPLLTRADLESQHAMYAKLFERLEALMREGKGPDEALAAKPAEEFGSGRGDPTLFLTLAFQSMWGHFAPNA